MEGKSNPKIDKAFDEIIALCKTRHDDADSGKFGRLRTLLEQHGHECVNKMDDYERYTPLLWAAKAGNVAICVLLLDHGAQIDKQGGWNKTTALMRAAQKNRTEVVGLLCDRGALLNEQNQFHMTALMLAAEMGHLESVKMLLSKGADPNLKNADEYTALVLASEAGYVDVVKAICQHLKALNPTAEKVEGIDIPNKFGKTPLIMAAEFNKIDVLKVLVSYNADINYKSKRGMTGLKLAAVKKNQAIVEYLCHLGASMEGVLSMAASGKGDKIVEFLRTFIAAHKEEILKKNKKYDYYQDHLSALYSAHQSEAITGALIGEVKSEKDLEGCPTPSGNGSTALMLACEKGQFDVVRIFLDKKIEFMEKSHQDGSVLDSSLWMKTNKEGNTAMSLLAAYYRDHEGTDGNEKCYALKMVEAVVKAPYYLDMLPMILPKSKSPNRLMNIIKDEMIAHLKGFHGYEADLQLVGALCNIAAALAASAETHPIEARDLLELQEKFELALCEVMNSVSMDVPENVTRVLRRIGDDKHRTPEIVAKALTFVSGPLHNCLRYGLTKILATGQILTFVNTIFYGSLKSNRESTIKNMSDLFQLRAGCSTYRYCPVVMFMFEGISKLIFVVIVSVVCIAMSSEKDDDHCEVGFASTLGVKCGHLPYWKNSLLIMLLTSFIYEVGEVINKINRTEKYSSDDAFTRYISLVGTSITKASEHFSDRWNLLDILTIFFISIWALYEWIYEVPASHDQSAQAWLSMSAISISLGLLRFQSMSKSTGQLVIMVFEMINDLQGFLLVFLTCILGFGIAFHSLFPRLDAFNSWHSTSLTLFDAALGNHDFNQFSSDGTDHQSIGIILMMVYTILVMIVLLNLIIARMSATHEKIDESALEVWARMQAINTEDFVLLYERNCMCMLPPPLNILSCAAAVAVSTHEFATPLVSSLWRGEEGTKQKSPFLRGFSYFKEKAIKICVSPYTAMKSVYDTNKQLWEKKSKVNTRELRIGVTFATVALFPVWVLLFWVKIVYDIIMEKDDKSAAQAESSNDSVMSFAGTVSDKITSLVFSPVCALLEVVYLNIAIWNSVAPRWIPACVSVMSVVFLPVWAVMFWLMIFWSIVVEDFTMIHRSTTRIHFDDMDHIRNSFKLKKHELCLTFVVSSIIVAKVVPQMTTPICLIAAGVLQVMDPVLANGSMVAQILDWRFSQRSVKKVGSKAENDDDEITSEKLGKGTRVDFKAIPGIVNEVLHSSLADLCAEKIMKGTLKSSFPESTNKYIVYTVLNAFIFGFLPGFILPSRLFNLFAAIVVVLLINHYYYELKDRRRASKNSEPMTPTVSNMKHESMDPVFTNKTKKKTRTAQSAKKNRNDHVGDCGTLELAIIRGNFAEKGESDFYRKINPYIVVNYPYVSKEKVFMCNSQHTRTYPRAGANCMCVDEVIRIHLETNAFEIEFQVYDQDDMDSTDVTHDELLYWKKMDIREWIANKRFEGDIFLHDSRGERKDSIQVNAKIKYPLAGKESPNPAPTEQTGAAAPKELFSAADRKRIFKILEAGNEEMKSQDPMQPAVSEAAREKMQSMMENWLELTTSDIIKKQIQTARKKKPRKLKSARPVDNEVQDDDVIDEAEEGYVMVSQDDFANESSEVDCGAEESKGGDDAATFNTPPVATAFDSVSAASLANTTSSVMEPSSVARPSVVAFNTAATVQEEPSLAPVETSEATANDDAFASTSTESRANIAPIAIDIDTIEDGVTDVVDDEDNELVGDVDGDRDAFSDTGAVMGTDAGTDYESDAGHYLPSKRAPIVLGLASAVHKNESIDTADNENQNAESAYSFRSSSVRGSGASLGSVSDNGTEQGGNEANDEVPRRISLSMDASTPVQLTTRAPVSPLYSRFTHPNMAPFSAAGKAPRGGASTGGSDFNNDDDSLIRNNLLLVYALDLRQSVIKGSEKGDGGDDGNVLYVLHESGFADCTIELLMSAAQAREIERKTESPVLHVCVCHHYFNTEPVLGSFDPRLDDFIVLPTLFFSSAVPLELDGLNISAPIYVHARDGLSLDEVSNRMNLVTALPAVASEVNLHDLGNPILPCADPEHWRVQPCRGAQAVTLSVGAVEGSNLLTAQFRVTSTAAVTLMVNPSHPLSGAGNGPLKPSFSSIKPRRSPRAQQLLSGSLMECWDVIQTGGIQGEVVNLDRLSVRRRERGETWDVYLSYWWGLDERGADVHERVGCINDALVNRGLRTNFNENFVFGDTTANIMRAVVDSKVLVCFVTQAYLDSVHRENTGHVQSSTRVEFFAAEFHGMFRGRVVVVVLEKRCRKAYLWGGDVGGSFSELLYVDFVEESPLSLYEAQADDLASKIRTLIAQRGDSSTPASTSTNCSPRSANGAH